MGKDEVVRALEQAREVLIMTHIQPDGDALGSALALAGGLSQMGKGVQVAVADQIPNTLGHLPGAQQIHRPQSLKPGWDLVVAVDAADQERLGEAGSLFTGLTVNIDHHPSNTGYAQINWIDPEASATAEMVYTLLGELGVRLDPRIGNLIYAGLHTDTGGFRFRNTRGETLQIAAEVVAQGANPAEVCEGIYERRSLGSLQLQARALASLQVRAGGRLAWMSLSMEDLAQTGVSPHETEGLVSLVRSIEGVVIALLFREEEGGVKLSLRSRDPVDVGRIAADWGGGGHKYAAGVTLSGSLEDVTAQTVAALEPLVREG